MSGNLARKYALVAITEACDQHGVTWWGIDSIAEAADESPRALRVHVGALERDGLIVRYRRHRANGSRTSDLIVLTMPREQPLFLVDYDGKAGGRIGARVGGLEPPEHARIVDDLATRSRTLDDEPSDAIRSNLATRLGQTYRRDHGGPPDQEVVQVVDQGERARADAAHGPDSAVSETPPPKTFEDRLQTWHASELSARNVRPPAPSARERQAAAAINERVHGDCQAVKDCFEVALQSKYLAPKVRTLVGFEEYLDELLLKAQVAAPTELYGAGSTCLKHDRVVTYRGPRCEECERLELKAADRTPTSEPVVEAEETMKECEEPETPFSHDDDERQGPRSDKHGALELAGVGTSPLPAESAVSLKEKRGGAQRLQSPRSSNPSNR